MTPTPPLTNAETEASALLLFSLGPVQEFIAAGRRTADLWAGSALLSHLAGHALGVVEGRHGRRAVLFPDRTTGAPPGYAGVPNRFVARVPAGGAAKLAEDAADAVRDEIEQVAASALKAVQLPEVRGAEARRFIEVYWVVLPDAPDTLLGLYQADGTTADAYGARYRVLEGLAGGRKALRNFGGAQESGYRCSLMPSQQAVVEAVDPRPGEVRGRWREIARNSNGRIRVGEQLSVVALTKRYYPDYARQTPEAEAAEAFPSTSSFAAADFVAAVLKEAVQCPPLLQAIRDFEAAFHKLPGTVQRRYREAAITGVARARQGVQQAVGVLHHLSGRLLLTDDLTPEEVEKETGVQVSQNTLDAFLRAQRRLLAEATRAGVRPPSRYYAVLVLDGDHMGRWLSGEKRFPEGDERATLTEEDRHRAISRALDGFARNEVRKIVEEGTLEKKHLGRLVYGGGDDVLALFSFQTALPAARALSDAFRKALPGGTASAGLVYAHHLTPLQQVLDAARAAEKRAKNTRSRRRPEGRDQLAITALKRSGEPAEVAVPWDDLGPLVDYADLIREKEVSTGLLYDLEDLRRRLSDLEGELMTGMDEAASAEARRLFLRRVERVPKEEREAAFERTVGAAHDALRLDGAVALLHVAQFIGKGGDR